MESNCPGPGCSIAFRHSESRRIQGRSLFSANTSSCSDGRFWSSHFICFSKCASSLGDIGTSVSVLIILKQSIRNCFPAKRKDFASFSRFLNFGSGGILSVFLLLSMSASHLVIMSESWSVIFSSNWAQDNSCSLRFHISYISLLFRDPSWKVWSIMPLNWINILAT